MWKAGRVEGICNLCVFGAAMTQGAKWTARMAF